MGTSRFAGSPNRKVNERESSKWGRPATVETAGNRLHCSRELGEFLGGGWSCGAKQPNRLEAGLIDDDGPGNDKLGLQWEEMEINENPSSAVGTKLLGEGRTKSWATAAQSWPWPLPKCKRPSLVLGRQSRLPLAPAYRLLSRSVGHRVDGHSGPASSSSRASTTSSGPSPLSACLTGGED